MVAYRKHKSYFETVKIRNYLLNGPVTFARLMFIYETLVIAKMHSKYLCFFFPNLAISHKHNGSQINLQGELVGVYLLLWSCNIARLEQPSAKCKYYKHNGSQINLQSGRGRTCRRVSFVMLVIPRQPISV